MPTEKYQNKYRIASIRMKNYDYSSNGAYFITIVTKNREHFFGEVVNDKNGLSYVSLSEIGKIVWDEWLKTPKIRPYMNLTMMEFVVMPNHIHGIIYIGKNEFNTNDGVAVDGDAISRRDAMHRVSTNTEYKNKFEPQRKNLASIIRGFKSAVTTKSRKLNTKNGISNNFSWQSRFHDRIIRNKNELNRIRNYIIKNPEMWNRDNNNGDLWL